MDDYALTDALDHEIIMHRDAHFSGAFAPMIAYYTQEGKGAHPDFEIERIEALKQMEESLGENLSLVLLSDEERALVKKAKESYLKLREVFEQKTFSEIPRLVADLILTEEDEPTQLIHQLVEKGTAASSALIDLVRSEDFYNPLFPGYGFAPALAAKCLGLLKETRAIQPLFEAMGRDDFFAEEEIIEGLYQIGAPARDFLLKVLKKLPLTQDNERAAIALIRFEGDEQVAEACREMLANPAVLKHPILVSYLELGAHK